MEQLIIAIDGYSACGKSTLAKELADRLDLVYIDTGAMYRAVALYFNQHNISIDNTDRVENALDKIDITFKNLESENICFLNGINVEKEIRSQKISDLVSEVSTISEVRKKMVALQREMGESMNLVMDGRDIGTVVYPSAKYKFFLTANENIRAERRLKEFHKKGIRISRKEVVENLQKRDYIDSNREDSPLKVADNAITINNSYLDKKEQIELVCKIIEIGKDQN